MYITKKIFLPFLLLTVMFIPLQSHCATAQVDLPKTIAQCLKNKDITKAATTIAILTGGVISVHLLKKYILNEEFAKKLLVWAVQNKKRGLITVLQKVGANINSVNPAPLLHAACKEDNLELVQFLKTIEGITLDVRDTNGTTALYLAIEKGHTQIAQEIIAGYTPEQLRAETNRTYLLHLAAQYNNLTIFKKLLAVNSDINRKDQHGKTAIQIAIHHEHKEIVKLLKKSDGIDRKLFYEAMQNELCDAAGNNDADKVGALLQDEATINDPNGKGNTALYSAIKANHHDLAHRLIDEHDSEQLRQATDLVKCFHIAAFWGNCAILKKFLDAGVEVDLVSDERKKQIPITSLNHQYPSGLIFTKKVAHNRTALYHAIVQGNKEAAQLLIDTYEPEKLRQEINQTRLLYLAAKEENTEILDMLIRAGADCKLVDTDGNTVLQFAMNWGGAQAIRKLIEVPGIDLNCRDEYGMPLLLWAYKKRLYDIIEKLLENPAIDVNIMSNSDERMTLLHATCLQGHVDFVQKLLDRQELIIDQHSKLVEEDNSGPTALTWAVIAIENDGINTNNYLSIIKKLIKKGANPHKLMAWDDRTNNIDIELASSGKSAYNLCNEIENEELKKRVLEILNTYTEKHKVYEY